jgi:hypothetical protein
MVALAIFQSLIWVGVVIGKFVIELGFRIFFNTKTTWSGSVLTSGLLACFVALQYWIEFCNG